MGGVLGRGVDRDGAIRWVERGLIECVPFFLLASVRHDLPLIHIHTYIHPANIHVNDVCK